MMLTDTKQLPTKTLSSHNSSVIVLHIGGVENVPISKFPVDVGLISFIKSHDVSCSSPDSE